MKQSKEFLLHKEIAVETVGNGVTRQILGYNSQILLAKITFQKGSVGDVHQHPHVQTSYIESGKFEVMINNNKQILEKGDGFFVPGDTDHGVLCLEEGVIIDTFTPAREDFLK